MRFASEGRRVYLLNRSLPTLAAFAVLGAISAATLTGCGIGNLDSSSPQVAQVVPAFQGTMMGGQSPIVNAKLQVYATGSDGSCTSSDSAATCIASDTGYGVATLLQEATVVSDCGSNGTTACAAGQETDSSGNFSFAGGYFCPAGEFAYLVGSGGSPGSAGASANSKILLVAALGRCEDLYTAVTGGYSGYTGSPVVVNEITTVAAGYALGNFATVSGTTVSIGAPSTNNAAQVSTVSTGSTTGAAGLYHAFLNAANLASPFSLTTLSTAPTIPPGNSTANPPTLPTALINTIANILANCVDSAGTGGQCSGLPGGSDTFTAVKTLAANPTFSGSSSAVSTFFNLPTGAAQFSPILAGTPNDYSIAIAYPKGTGCSVVGNCIIGLTYPIFGALNVNDVYFLGNQSHTTATTPVNIIAFDSNGTVHASTSLNVNVYTLGLSMDALGHGYFGTGSSIYSVYYFNTGSAAGDSVSSFGNDATAYHFASDATAVDQHNNLIAFGTAGVRPSSGNLQKFPNAYSSATSTDIADVAVTIPADNTIALAIDPQQNLWTAASGVLTVYPNNGSLSAPTYTGTPIASPAPSGSPISSITFAGNSSGYIAYLASYTTTPGVQAYTPVLSGPTIISLSAGTLATATNMTGTLGSATDGAGTVWLADASAAVIAYNPTAGTFYSLKPAAAGTTYSNALAATSGAPGAVAIDSTGSMWVPDELGQTLFQIIGSAAPTWPLLSLGKLGMP